MFFRPEARTSMSQYKENESTTPTRTAPLSSPSYLTSPLKPTSPSKQNVGRLSFLQNDKIDDNFNLIHSSNNEIQSQLSNLEVQTKQTALDLGQLCDRLKNNNQHLNKLLENIASYSEEVITEGNATKNDITNIMTRLDDFNEKLTLILTKSEPEIDFIKDTNITINNKLNDIPTKSDLQDVKESLKHTIDNSEHSHDSGMIKLKETIENQNQLINKLLDQTSLNSRCNNLEDKYKLLCQAYETKYNDLKNLELKFQSLSSSTDELNNQLKFELNDESDIIKMNKIKKFHNLKMNNIQESSENLVDRQDQSKSSFLHKRIMSTPTNYVPKLTSHLDSIHSVNNSDDD